MAKHCANLLTGARVGLDLVKNVFQLHAVDGNGVVILARSVRRGSLLKLSDKLPRCEVAMGVPGFRLQRFLLTRRGPRGRLLGDAAFLAGLEARLGRALRAKPRGPKPKERARIERAELSGVSSEPPPEPVTLRNPDPPGRHGAGGGSEFACAARSA